jgi:hypothetical protein
MENFDLLGEFGEFGDGPFHLSVDLDSTLCDTRHRKGIIEKYVNAGLPIDWDDYSRHALKDEPTGLVALLQHIQYAVPWHVTSGRSQEALDVTHRWLERHKLKPVSVNLETSREEHLKLGHVEWKVQHIMGLAEVHPIRLHIDDWADIAVRLEQESKGRIKGMTVTPPGMKAFFADAVEPVKHVEAPAENPAEEVEV